jgi:hypothetical protein
MAVEATECWGPVRRVLVSRPPGHPLGIAIVGGRVELRQCAVMGIFIKSVIADSPAGRSGPPLGRLVSGVWCLV